MREEEQSDGISQELLDRLKALEATPTAGSLAEIAYARARDALDHALQEARSIRLAAIEDARRSRERELTSTLESLRALRESAELQINAMIAEAEYEVEARREQSKAEAREIITFAEQEAERIREEAQQVRLLAEQRLRDIEQLEIDFNRLVQRIADRLDLAPTQVRDGWFRHITGRSG